MYKFGCYADIKNEDINSSIDVIEGIVNQFWEERIYSNYVMYNNLAQLFIEEKDKNKILGYKDYLKLYTNNSSIKEEEEKEIREKAQDTVEMFKKKMQGGGK